MYDEMPMQYHELPKFYLRQEDLPEILKWKVGGQYYLVMKVEMVGVEKMADMPTRSDKAKYEGEFKVHSIRALDTKPVDVKTLEKKAWDKTIAKIKSGEY